MNIRTEFYQKMTRVYAICTREDFVYPERIRKAVVNQLRPYAYHSDIHCMIAALQDDKIMTIMDLKMLSRHIVDYASTWGFGEILNLVETFPILPGMSFASIFAIELLSEPSGYSDRRVEKTRNRLGEYFWPCERTLEAMAAQCFTQNQRVRSDEVESTEILRRAIAQIWWKEPVFDIGHYDEIFNGDYEDIIKENEQPKGGKMSPKREKKHGQSQQKRNGKAKKRPAKERKRIAGDKEQTREQQTVFEDPEIISDTDQENQDPLDDQPTNSAE